MLTSQIRRLLIDSRPLEILGVLTVAGIRGVVLFLGPEPHGLPPFPVSDALPCQRWIRVELLLAGIVGIWIVFE